LSDENVDLANRFHWEIFQHSNFSVADELLSSDFRWHGGMGQGTNQSRPENIKQIASAISSAFPDREITHLETIALGDEVIIRWSMTGTHQGPLLGIPPSNKLIMVTGSDSFRIADGKIVELSQEMDQLDLVRQLRG
jgi:steroid delta-isomerase-like uncharacterized protein